MNDRLYRSREDRIIGGVCGGLADRLDIDPSLVRVGWVLLTIVTGGAFLLLYIVMLFVVPEEPIGGFAPAPPPPGPDAVPGWQGPGSEPAVGSAAAGVGAATTVTGGAPPVGGEPAEGAGPSGQPTPEGWQAPGGATPPAGAPAAAWIPPDQAYAARRAERARRRQRRGGAVGLFFGALLILLGVWLLFRQYLPDVDLQAFWPVAIMVLGVVLLVGAFRPQRGGDSS